MDRDRITTINPSWQLIELPREIDLAHQLLQTDSGWQCQCCYRDWQKKPRGKCFGLPMFPHARHAIDGTRLMSIEAALRCNLRLRESTKPVAMSFSKAIGPRDLLFDRDAFIKCEPDFYPIAAWEKEDRPGLRTLWEINHRQLELKDGTKPAAVYFSDWSDSQVRWRLLYAIADTQPKQPKYISKANLKAIYSISDGWLARIGEPDSFFDNPHGKHYPPMRMYSIVRVEHFLATHAQEYAEWLEKRGKRLEIARLVVANSQTTKFKVQAQTQQCLECASHSALLGGTCCAIHPLGLPPGVPLEFYCTDFHPKKIIRAGGSNLTDLNDN